MADDNNTGSANKPDSAGSKPAKAPKGSKESIQVRLTKWFTAKKNEYLAEFKRIVWPTRDVLIKETITVMTISIIFGIYIALLDGVFGLLYTQFTQLTSTLFS